MNAEHLKRFDRQTRLPMIGLSGQRRLEVSTVGILGCGALGSVAAELLARAGVGRLRLIDRDVVEWTNLQRQSLYIEDDARQGRAKADAACERLQQINSQSHYDPMVIDITSANIHVALADVDLVIDASDNFGVRMLLNDYSLEHRLPWVHGGCVGTGGQLSFFTGQGYPCFRCLVPEVPPASAVATCDTAGVLGPATHAIASLQAAEALKWLTGMLPPFDMVFGRSTFGLIGPVLSRFHPNSAILVQPVMAEKENFCGVPSQPLQWLFVDVTQCRSHQVRSTKWIFCVWHNHGLTRNCREKPVLFAASIAQ